MSSLFPHAGHFPPLLPRARLNERKIRRRAICLRSQHMRGGAGRPGVQDHLHGVQGQPGLHRACFKRLKHRQHAPERDRVCKARRPGVGCPGPTLNKQKPGRGHACSPHAGDTETGRSPGSSSQPADLGPSSPKETVT